jgi:hypothetical protein
MNPAACSYGLAMTPQGIHLCMTAVAFLTSGERILLAGMTCHVAWRPAVMDAAFVQSG